MIIGIGFFFAKPARLQGLSKSYFYFILFYFAGALWSSSVAWGLFNKGMLVATAGAGFMMAHCIRDIQDLKKGLHILGIVAAGAGIWVFVIYLRNPGDSVVLDRLAVANMNANSLGQAAACLLVFSVHAVLNEKRKGRRTIGLMSSALLSWVVLSTGSRGAVLFCIISLLALSYPTLKRYFASIVTFGILGLLVFFAYLEFGVPKTPSHDLMDIESNGPQIGVSRLSKELTKNTREGIWKYAFREYKTSPIIGVGWSNFRGRSRNFMNVYLQVLLETGVVGALLFSIVLIKIVGTLMRKPDIPPQLEFVQSHFMAIGMVGALLAHGIAESSTLLGTTPNAMLIAFSLGLIDRLPYLAGNYAPRQQQAPPTHSPYQQPFKPSSPR